MKLLDRFLKLLNMYNEKLETLVGTRVGDPGTAPNSPTFDTSIRWKDPIREATVEECIHRLNRYMDDTHLMSNEPTKDDQAWVHLKFLALIGERVHSKRLEGGKQAVIDWVNSLPEDPK